MNCNPLRCPTAMLVAAAVLARVSADPSGTAPWARKLQGAAAIIQPPAEENSQMAADIVRGLTESFLGKSVTSNERYCLAGGAGKLAGGIMDTTSTTVGKLHELFGNVQGIAANAGYALSPQMATPPPLTTPLPYGAPYPTTPPGVTGIVQQAVPAQVVQTGEAAVTTVELARLTAIELAHTLTSMFGFEHQLTKSCLSDDAMATFDKAKANLANLSFVGGHLVANGVTIVDDLAGAVTAYDGQNYRGFGEKIGHSWRQVALAKGESSSSLTTNLKELMVDLEPSKIMKEMEPDAMERTLKGFVSSMFGDGFSVELAVDGTTTVTTIPYTAGWTPPNSAPNGMMTFKFPQQLSQQVFGAGAEQPTEVNVDMHECIGGNMELFGNAWEPVAGLGEQFMEGHCTGAVRSLCMSLWTVVLTDVQQALKTCGFTPEQEKILLHSMWAGQSVKTELSMPDQQVKATDMTVTMASAVEDYKEGHYERFGKALGTICRDMVVVSFPQQWEIDSHGRLREKLQGMGKQAPAFVTFLAVSSLLLAVVVMRRARMPTGASLLQGDDVEMSDTLE